MGITTGPGTQGFLQGFLQTSVALQQFQAKRQQEMQELELRKEDLGLRRDLLKGQEASRKLQDQLHALSIQKMLEEYGRRQAAGEVVSRAYTPEADTQPLPQVVPRLTPDGGPATLTPPPARTTPPPGPGPGAAGTAPPAQTQAVFNAITDNVAASEQVQPEVVELFKTAVLPQETRNYDSQAVSPRGAQGLSQLMPATAQSVGVTEPFNPVQNIRGGLRYLQQLYTQFRGNVEQTLAAYNAGPGRVTRTGGVPNIPETQRYVRNGTAAYAGQTLAASAPTPLPASEASGLSPLTGEVIGRLPNGRPIIRTADGGISTERLVGVNFGNDYYNIPTMFGGREVSVDEAVRIVKANNFIDPDTGQQLPRYRTQQEADIAAEAQHQREAVIARQALAAPGATPVLPPATVTAPREPASPLVRQPSGLAESPELTNLNARIAELDTVERRIQDGLRVQPQLRTDPQIEKTLADLRTNRTELLRQRTELVKEQAPANVFTAILKRNNGDLDASIREYQEFEIEKARQNQAAGLSTAAQKAAETKTAEQQAQQRFKEGQTLLDVDRQTSRQYFDVQTGNPLPQSSRYQDVLGRVERGEVVFLDDQEAKNFRDIQRMVPLLNQIKEQIARVYGPGGIFENLPADQRLAAGVRGGLARLTQSNPQLAEADRVIRANVDNLRRSLQGQVGTQTEQDAQRGLAALPQVGGVPDSRDVAYNLYNTLLETVNGMLGTYLGTPTYQHPKLAPLAEQSTRRRVIGTPTLVEP